MAIKKATTTEDLTASAEDPTPTLSERVEQIAEVTDPAMVAKVDAPKYHKVKAPSGEVSTVPDSILDALLDSGYTKSK